MLGIRKSKESSRKQTIKILTILDLNNKRTFLGVAGLHYCSTSQERISTFC